MSPDEWALLITGVITAATAITAATPSNSDNKALNGILMILNMVAGNVGKNKNGDAK